MTRPAVGSLLAFAALAFLAGAGTVRAETLRVEVLDVGQGDAILVRTPAMKTILIDAGEEPARIASLLSARDVVALDLVIATHPHADHIGGMEQVVSSRTVKLYTDSGLVHSTATYLSLMKAIELRKVPYRTAVVGTTYRLDDGAVLEILFPDGIALKGTRSDLNSNSVVVRLRHQGNCMLFLGDAEEPTERALLARELGPCDVLKVAHHGSEHSSSEAFLQAVRPKVALISVGERNGYSHPGTRTLGRLAAAGARVYRTDLLGTLTVLSSERGIEVLTEREAAPAPTPAPVPTSLPSLPQETAAPARSLEGAQCAFVASAASKVFHAPGCRNAGKIAAKNFKCYREKTEAVADHKHPAGCCRP